MWRLEADDAAPQRHRRDRQLEGRRRRVPSVDGAVDERVGLVRDEVPVIGARDAAGEKVRVVRRRGVKRADLALRRHRDHGAPYARGPDAVDVPLQVEVDRGVQCPARYRRQRRGARLVAHQAAARVHLDVAHAFAAPQRVVVLPLDPGTAHDRPRLCARKPVRGELGVGHLRHVAHDVRHRLPRRVEPARFRLEHQARQQRAMFLEPARRLERRLAEHHRRLVPRAAPAAHDIADPGAVERHDRREPAQHRAAASRHCWRSA